MSLDLDRDLESNPEYRRILAGLSPDERLRLLGDDFDLQRQLQRKRDYSRTLRELPADKKLLLLEELRQRAQLQRGNRRSPSPVDKPPRPKVNTRRFGGRATAGGVAYEESIAAFIGVKMLAGSRSEVWDGISGDAVSAIAMQAPEPVDDIVVTLRADDDVRVFISAKERSGKIALTERSPAFVDTARAFVRQFLSLSRVQRSKSRLVWAFPSAAGQAITIHLLRALDTLRIDARDTLSDFSQNLQTPQRTAFEAWLSVVKKEWGKESGHLPTDDELATFLRLVHVDIYDFAGGQRLERNAIAEIRSYIVADSNSATLVWQKLKRHFKEVNQRGLRVTPSSVRRVLTDDGLELQSPPDYAKDVARLKEVTQRYLNRLEEHASLRFGSDLATDVVTIERKEELGALNAAVRAGHLLITGEPGCGKSGLIYRLVKSLQQDGVPVVLLLAEEIFALNLVHGLDEVLCNWPGGKRGILVTDALDAVRDMKPQKLLRSLFGDVQEGDSGWNVVASIREFDLKYGRELRESFPGAGAPGHESTDFAGVAHFYLTGLAEPQLDELAARRPEIHPFIKRARENPRSAGIHRSPFYLRLAADLLRSGEKPERLADWDSPAVLLRRFWEVRVKEAINTHARSSVLRAICGGMVESGTMAISLKELELGAAEMDAIQDLRSGGILQSPALRRGTRHKDDELRFTHHLLHDYAIARALIPEVPERFCVFVADNTLLPISYRQSFIFVLEEIWDEDAARDGFWRTALQLEGLPGLHSITRILAPVLAARRVESLADLQPLLTEIVSVTGLESAAMKALQHLASGLQDASLDAVGAALTGWCLFAEELSKLLPTNAGIEGPLVHIIARLNQLESR